MWRIVLCIFHPLQHLFLLVSVQHLLMAVMFLSSMQVLRAFASEGVHSAKVQEILTTSDVCSCLHRFASVCQGSTCIFHFQCDNHHDSKQTNRSHKAIVAC
jgi:hypothetical protein